MLAIVPPGQRRAFGGEMFQRLPAATSTKRTPALVVTPEAANPGPQPLIRPRLADLTAGDHSAPPSSCVIQRAPTIGTLPMTRKDHLFVAKQLQTKRARSWYMKNKNKIPGDFATREQLVEAMHKREGHWRRMAAYKRARRRADSETMTGGDAYKDMFGDDARAYGAKIKTAIAKAASAKGKKRKLRKERVDGEEYNIFDGKAKFYDQGNNDVGPLATARQDDFPDTTPPAKTKKSRHRGISYKTIVNGLKGGKNNDAESAGLILEQLNSEEPETDGLDDYSANQKKFMSMFTVASQVSEDVRNPGIAKETRSNLREIEDGGATFMEKFGDPKKAALKAFRPGGASGFHDDIEAQTYNEHLSRTALDYQSDSSESDTSSMADDLEWNL